MTYEGLQFPYLQSGHTHSSTPAMWSREVMACLLWDQLRQLKWRYRNSDSKRTTSPSSCTGRGCFDCRDKEGDQRAELWQRWSLARRAGLKALLALERQKLESYVGGKALSSREQEPNAHMAANLRSTPIGRIERAMTAGGSGP